MYFLWNFHLIFFIIFCTTIPNIIAKEKSILSNPINKYIKHMAGFTTKDYLSDKSILNEKFVGVIIDDGFILTNVAWDMNAKSKLFGSLGRKIVKWNIYGFAGEKEFNENKSDTAYHYAISQYDWVKHIYSKTHYLPTLKYIADSPIGEQITLIVPEKNLLEKDNVEAIKLATVKPAAHVNCIIITYGKLGDANVYNSTYIKVKTMPEEYCSKELCEYNDPICVTSFVSNYSINDHLNGGEPLICNNELWGIIRGGYILSKAAPAASVFESRKWIRKQKRIYKKYIQKNWVKSDAHQAYSVLTFPVIIISIVFNIHIIFDRAFDVD